MEREQKLTNFRKARSLLDKIISMIEAEDYCIDIMQQNLAAIGILKSAHQSLLEDHLHHCFYKAMDSKQDKRKLEMIDEILKVTKYAGK